MSNETLKDFRNIMQQPLERNDKSEIAISLFGSSQEVYIKTMSSKLNNLQGAGIYNIRFKVIKQENYHVIIAMGKGYCSQDEFRATLLSFFLEHITQLI